MSNRASQHAHQRRMSRLDRQTGSIFFGGFATIIATLVILAACTSRTEQARDIHDELVYFKDHRTDLCFAYWMISDDRQTSVMTNVPCDEKVERMIVNGAEARR